MDKGTVFWLVVIGAAVAYGIGVAIGRDRERDEMPTPEPTPAPLTVEELEERLEFYNRPPREVVESFLDTCEATVLLGVRRLDEEGVPALWDENFLRNYANYMSNSPVGPLPYDALESFLRQCEEALENGTRLGEDGAPYLPEAIEYFRIRAESELAQ